LILTIAAKELRALFASPLAWLALTLLQLIIAYLFLKRLDDFLQIQPQLVQVASPPGVTELVVAPLFAATAAIFLFVVPLLAMRLIAEERRNRTMVLLTSAPVTVAEIITGKFLGLLVFLLLIIALVCLMPLSLAGSTDLDYGLMGTLAGGLVLLAAAFAAVGLYVSCLTQQPVVAALGGMGLLLVMVLLGEGAGDTLQARGWSLPAAFVQVLSPLKNFEPLARGVIDTQAVACLLLLTAGFLILAVRHLDGRRLRGWD